jgi:RES domain
VAVARGPSEVAPPRAGLWRVARGDNPLAVHVDGTGNPVTGGNRFDPVSLRYGVLYFGSDLQTCFGETLARFRPKLELLALVRQEWEARGFMAIGAVAADWRQRRSAVRVRLPTGVRFLDVESPQTHQVLRRELALGLSSLGLSDLDVAAVRGPDRRVTQLISEWAYMAEGDEGPRYVGIRYQSRLRSEWECWAVFDDEDLEIEVLETLPITPDMPALLEVAELFDLQIF